MGQRWPWPAVIRLKKANATTHAMRYSYDACWTATVNPSKKARNTSSILCGMGVYRIVTVILIGIGGRLCFHIDVKSIRVDWSMELTVSSILRLRSQLTVNTEYLLLFYITVQWCPLQIIAGGFNSEWLLTEKIKLCTQSVYTCVKPHIIWFRNYWSTVIPQLIQCIVTKEWIGSKTLPFCEIYGWLFRSCHRTAS